MSLSTREALERALVQRPDDVALHAAYADLLMEEGDPRGEYIQMRLALEDRSLPTEEARRLNVSSLTMLTKHRDAWLGDLSTETERSMLIWHRGWLNTVTFQPLTIERMHAFQQCPVTRMTQGILIDGVEDLDEVENHKELNDFFLYLSDCPLAYLTIREKHLGDQGVSMLIEAGLLRRLEFLFLLDCGITDSGAVELARCPDMPRIQHLSIDNNQLSEVGIDALREIGFVVSGPQWADRNPDRTNGYDMDIPF